MNLPTCEYGEVVTGAGPHVRQVNGEIVRYVQPDVEDTRLQATRRLGATEAELLRALAQAQDRVEGEFSLARQFGVPMLDGRVEIGKVPVFGHAGRILGEYMGLHIVSPIVDGTELTKYEPQTNSDRESLISEISLTCASLEKYVLSKSSKGNIFCDIYSPRQLMVGPPQAKQRLVVVDLDPDMVPAEAGQVRVALEDVANMQYRMTMHLAENFPDLSE